jgi:DNA-binding CsgD family transcriptional regulator/tetratricopeptide (TPR) repeat protein
LDADSSVRSQWPLVGRADALERVRGVLAGGAASAVLLTGPSGIGKSRLAAEAAAGLSSEEWAIITVAASAMLSASPLGALIPAIAAGRGTFVNVGRDSLVVFEVVREAIEKIAAGRRVVLLLDDVWLLDSLSLTVIVQLVAAQSVSIVATVRSGEPLPDAFVSMWTTGVAARVELQPLTVGDCETLLALALGGRVAHTSAIELHALSGGNALFLRELVIGAYEDGQLRDHNDVWQLVGKPLGTPALRDLIRARLAHLDESETRLVERIAVCQPLAVADLPDGSKSALRCLEAAGLVRVDDQRGRLLVSLDHPQYAEAVRSALTRLATIDILVDQADLVASRPMSAEDELRIALWRLDAGVQSDPEILSRAAHLAFLAGDNERAERLAMAAVDAGAPAAEMLYLQGQAAWTLGRVSEALVILARATDEDELNPTTLELSGLIATSRAATYAGEIDGNAKGLAVLDEAERRHPELAGVLALQKAVLLGNLGQPMLAVEALELAEPRGATEAARKAVLDLSRALPLASLGRSPEAVAAARAAVEYASTDPQPVFPLRRAQMVLATALLDACRLDEARAVTQESLHDCIQHDDEVATRYNEHMLGQIHLLMGKLETAGRWFGDVISGAQARGPASYIEPARALLAQTLLWRGKTTEAAAVLGDVTGRSASETASSVVAAIWLDAVRGGKDRAIATLIKHARDTQADGNVLLTVVFLSAAARLGGHAQAAPLLAQLAEHTTSPLVGAQAQHAAAEVAATVPTLVAAGEQWESLGCLLFAAEAFTSAAGAARRGNSEREAVNLQNRANQLIAQCEGAATPLLQFAEAGGQLTQREKEIAGLAALGLSSVDIAKRLFLSPRTVNNHLHAAYAKLGVRSRSELRLL